MPQHEWPPWEHRCSTLCRSGWHVDRLSQSDEGTTYSVAKLLVSGGWDVTGLRVERLGPSSGEAAAAGTSDFLVWWPSDRPVDRSPRRRHEHERPS